MTAQPANRRIVAESPDTPPPGGPYAPSVRIGAVVAVAGQGGFDADGNISPDIGEQTRQTMSNVLAALAASGATAGDVLQVRVFLTDRAHFEPMNEVYREFFTEPFPARTTVFVTLPQEPMLIEVDALAVLPEAG